MITITQFLVAGLVKYVDVEAPIVEASLARGGVEETLLPDDEVTHAEYRIAANDLK